MCAAINLNFVRPFKVFAIEAAKRRRLIQFRRSSYNSQLLINVNVYENGVIKLFKPRSDVQVYYINEMYLCRARCSPHSE